MENIFISHFHSSLIKVSTLYRLRLLQFAALEFYSMLVGYIVDSMAGCLAYLAAVGLIG